MDATLSLMGKLCLEVFTRQAMRTLFRRFFEHIIYQVNTRGRGSLNCFTLAVPLRPL